VNELQVSILIFRKLVFFFLLLVQKKEEKKSTGKSKRSAAFTSPRLHIQTLFVLLFMISNV